MVVEEYFKRLDGPHPETVLDLLAPDFRFATLWGEPDHARPFGGGLAELQSYFAARDPDGQRHHITLATRAADGQEVAAGYTTRHGVPLASYFIRIQVDETGRIRRMLAARTSALVMAQ